MKNLFIKYSTAFKLKELGFNEPCFGYKLRKYSPLSFSLMVGMDTNLLTNSKFDVEDAVCIPLWQQIIDWFREKHEYSVSIHVDEDNSTPSNIKYWYCIDSFFEVPNNKIVREGIEEVGNFNSYQEAREQAILKAIKLIKK